MYSLFSTILLILGLAGIAGTTWLFPAIAAIVSRPRRARGPVLRGGYRPPVRIAVAVPAHNEERCLAETLVSIRDAMTELNHVAPEAKVELFVGLDGCTDGSREIALAHGAKLVESSECNGKWRTLLRLADRADTAQWIVFADAGVLWPKTLLAEFLQDFVSGSVIGVAPAYRNPGGGVVERALWGVEQHFKHLECRAGGPVSIHGATIAYRADALRRALRVLRRESWLNDDVVVPLTLRALHPDQRLRYRDDVVVRDQAHIGSTNASVEFRRRRRMVIGNIQWVLGLLPLAFQRDRVVGTLAMRRVFRLAWAYWAVFLFGAFFTLLAAVLTPLQLGIVSATIATMLIAATLIPTTRRLLVSARASLSFPLYLIPSLSGQGASWR